MIVNELAKAAGVEPHVVRYYTRIGLLRPARHPDNGYKLFCPNDIRRLQWIRRAQDVGFGLTEIASYLERHEDSKSYSTRIRDGLCRNIERNRARLAELQGLQERMESALAEWEQGRSGPVRELALHSTGERSAIGQCCAKTPGGP